jgi:hypothetical protein
MSPASPRITYNYLPDLAYFAAGAGPDRDLLFAALVANGFEFIVGTDDGHPAGELWIEPPGRPEVQISPPGTGPRQRYDTSSVITILGVSVALPRKATFKSGEGETAEEITRKLNAKGFKNVFGAKGKEKVTEVWVAPSELRVAPVRKVTEVVHDKSSLIVLVGKR